MYLVYRGEYIFECIYQGSLTDCENFVSQDCTIWFFYKPTYKIVPL